MALVAHPLINSDGLAERLRRSPAPVVLDVRWSLSGGADRAAYDVAHIPGAVFVDFGHDICGQPGDAGRHPLPETGALLGISPLGGRVVMTLDGTAVPR